MSVFVLVLGGRVEVDSLGGEVHIHDLLILLDLDDYLFFEDLFRVVLVLVCEAIGIERIVRDLSDNLGADAFHALFAARDLRFKFAVDNLGSAVASDSVDGGEGDRPLRNRFTGDGDGSGDLVEAILIATTDENGATA